MSLSAALALGAEEHHKLPAPPLVFGLTALAIFMVLLFVVTRFDPDR